MTHQLTTAQLLAHVKAQAGETVEATIHCGALRATHWMHYFDSRIWHEGIDSVMVRDSVRRILAAYPHTLWTVDDESDEEAPQ